jgi:hypothetical protein
LSLILLLLLPTFLFPVAVYFLALGTINRRPNPLLLPGVWDFAGLLFATSGFLIVGGPVLLRELYGLWHFHLLADPPKANWLIDASRSLRQAGLVLYFVLVVGGAVLMLRVRRKLTVIYNVEPAVFDEVCAQLLDGLGYLWARAGNQIVIRAGGKAGMMSRGSAAPATPTSPAPLSPQPPARSATDPIPPTLLQLEPSPKLCHVVLAWSPTDSPTRQEVERELDKVLADVPTLNNPLGSWFLLAGSVLFCLSCLFVGTALVILLLQK